LAEATKKPEDMNGHSFWSGGQCHECPEDKLKPHCEERGLQEQGDASRRVFNASTCTCETGPCLLQEDDCKNDGNLDKKSCMCTCVGNWTGPSCEDDNTDAVGTTQKKPAQSCMQILGSNPNATDDTYWLKSKVSGAEPLEVRCDMTGPDGGGWMEIAVAAADLEGVMLNASTYKTGVGSISKGDSFILPCAALDPGHDRVEMRMSIGDVRDFFKPIPGATLCDMLQSHAKHLWSASNGSPKTLSGWSELLKKVDMKPFGSSAPGESDTEEGTVTSLLQLLSSQGRSRQHRMGRFRRRLLMDAFADTPEPQIEEREHASLKSGRWVQPTYITEPKLAGLLGGCEKEWPRELDDREYLSLWGGDKGGCCHYTSSIYGTGEQQIADEGSWGRRFKLHIRSLDKE